VVNKIFFVCFGMFVMLRGDLLQIDLQDLKENPYGFVFVDRGITREDLAYFNQIDIQTERFYHHFGEVKNIESSIADFLQKVGENGEEYSLQIASRISSFAEEVVKESGKNEAWVHLRASIATDRYDASRWHFDGYYYTPEDADDLLFKFAATLVGPSTLFYMLPPELRKTIGGRIRDRKYMEKFCEEEQIVAPKLGEGAIFVGGKGVTALHSEPPIHEKRLFFSVVPATKAQLPQLKQRVLTTYPKDS